MSGAPRVRSMNVVESVGRPVLGPAGNKERTVVETRKPAVKPLKRVEKQLGDVEGKETKMALSPHSNKMQSIMRRRESRGLVNFSGNGSFSSDASTDSAHSRASSSGTTTKSRSGVMIKKKQCGLKVEKDDKVSVDGGSLEKFEKKDSGLVNLDDGLEAKKRCAWVTPNTDPCYVAFHDEEWGVPVHDDKKLFELLSLSGALAELTWPAILNKRNVFREVFLDFDPIAVSKLNEKKIVAPGSLATSLLSELKLRAIFENARQICKIIENFGSFDNYIWNYVSHKPVVSQFRHPRQVLVKTSKAEVISKELVKRGFRVVGPTVIYSFMQVAGLTNDHLISCFRFQECIAMTEAVGKNDRINVKVEQKKVEDMTELQLAGASLSN